MKHRLQVITAPDDLNAWNVMQYAVFLAGAIDMGAAVDWQSEVIRAWADEPLTVFNPRRPAFTADTLDEQIAWELEALERANVILMWLPANTKAPISLFEAGLYWRSRKLCIGADPAFYRRRNLELTGERYGVRVYSTLEATMAAALPRLVR